MKEEARLAPARGALPASSRYELLARIAAGGMGEVWAGRGRGASDLVAIKRVHRHMLEAEGVREAFAREAGLAARVRHPHVVAALDFEDEGGDPILVFEYVDGQVLSELFEPDDAAFGPTTLPPGVALRVLLDACAGLEAVHREGIAHADVSPQNVLVSTAGSALLFDFGAARSEAEPAPPTSPRGKVAYTAPEQIRGAPPARLGDVFSLGVVAWELVAGRRLFGGAGDAAAIAAVTSAAAPPLLSAVAGADVELAKLVAGALEKDPARRTPSVTELRARLEALAIAADLLAPREEVAALVHDRAGKKLEERRELARRALRGGL